MITSQEFEKQFKLLYRPLCLYAVHYVCDISQAEDIVQQAFIDIWDKHLSQVNDLKAYAYRIVRNQALKQIPDSTQADSANEFEALDEDERIFCSERDARLWGAIENLPASRKQIFLMAKRDGLRYEEIAQELSISVKTVENQVASAIKSLREQKLKIYQYIFDFIY